MKKTKKEDEYADLINEIQQDFKRRQEERRTFEAQWQLNLNFLMGNQYCSIGANKEIEDYDKQYFWQEREVYNHIAPMLEARMAKLSRVRPTMTVVPASSEDQDLKLARLSKNIINSAYHKMNINEIIFQATKWSEVCGSSFYKIMWNQRGGKNITKKYDGKDLYEGEIEIVAVPPFEIFPDSSCSENIEECNSIIHAKAYNVETIKNIWGIDVEGEDINVFSLENTQVLGGLGYVGSASKIVNVVKQNQAVVIERYEAPSIKCPTGRLVIVCNDKLLYIGELPYINLPDNKRGSPFVKQTAIENAGCFWGTSIIERTIPVQRAYNAVKNRKHEFLNRLSMGVLTVEDGSVDTENLEEEGLSPGKVLVYRQGSNPPSVMNTTRVPIDFTYEEERLLNEFTLISGVSDLMKNTTSIGANTSGVALQLLIEQDDTRISSTAENIRMAVKEVASQILRLYKQFASTTRLLKISGTNGEVETFYWEGSDINSDDIIFETENEIGETLAQKRSMVFELLNAGLLHDENGKLTNSMRVKALELLGFGVWESGVDINSLQTKKAGKENIEIMRGTKVVVEDFDDHSLHINEHISFLLSEEFEKNSQNIQKEKIKQHIREHKQALAFESQV